MARPERRESFLDQAWDTIKTVVYAVLIALLVRSVLFEPFRIPSGSMIPTLLVGDYLFVSKYSYGYSRHSFPFSLAPFSGRIWGAQPKVGDVAVFKNTIDGNKDYIKRVIGLPGDKVQVVKGILHVNGAAVPRAQVDHYVYVGDGGTRPDPIRATRFVETLPNGVKHEILEQSDDRFLDNTAVFTVPDGHVFMMGDNRDNSQDSRTGMVGFVPMENLIGRADFIFMSVASPDGSDSAWFWEFWNWRLSRFFTAIR